MPDRDLDSPQELIDSLKPPLKDSPPNVKRWKAL